MVMSNLPIFSWALAPTTKKCTSSILVSQGCTGTERHISIFRTKKTATLLEPPHLPQSTIIWVWNGHVATTWNPSPIFSYTSFTALSPGLVLNLQWTCSGTRQPSNGRWVHLLTSWALHTPTNLVYSLTTLAPYASMKNLTTPTCARSFVSSFCVQNISTR